MAFLFGAVVYNLARLSYRQAICPPQLLGRMNAAVRWVVWGTIPLGALLGGALGSLLGVRPTLWIAFAGSWAGGWWVFFSPLRRLRDVPRADIPRDVGPRTRPRRRSGARERGPRTWRWRGAARLRALAR